MANAPHLFEDLQLIDNAGKVHGIGEGLAIKGKGMFKFSIEDDNGKNHTIKIPNSLYVPGLKQCLLSPQHWAQEAGAGGKHGWGAELMRWHYRLGHLTFAKLRQLALNGEIPTKLAKVTPPKCAGCLFGAMTKIPWRGKETKASHEVFIATKPGECVSVDQMASTEVGFFAQMKGKLTKRRYRCATIFVDHFSRLRFVHLQSDDSSTETIEAKRAFETFAAEHGVRIQHYHCNNGRFFDNAFKQACHDAQQQLTFCGVNAHFQNGIAERSIRDLSENARKQLLHARTRWPQAVHFALWPYALRNAALLHNTLPMMEDGSSFSAQFVLVAT
jgi:hypothetical protein